MPIQSHKFLSKEEIIAQANELAKIHKLKEPSAPPFKPLNEYVDDKSISQISNLIVKCIEVSVKKIGYKIKKGKRDHLKEKIIVSLTGWGKESKYFFREISSDGLFCKSFLGSISSFFRKRYIIISDFSIIIVKVLKQLDHPSIKNWLDNEYNANKNFNKYRKNANTEMVELLEERKLEENRTPVSSPVRNMR